VHGWRIFALLFAFGNREGLFVGGSHLIKKNPSASGIIKGAVISESIGRRSHQKQFGNPARRGKVRDEGAGGES
jgi:hypothetical protein